jgi:quercetin dioxygenase-like cupin family protein
LQYGGTKTAAGEEEEKMPFYKIAEMQKNPATANPQQFVQTAVGEFMKAGIVTKPDEEGPPLHMHPNEEQFTLVIEGKLHFVLGDEERICEAGDLIHIPRFVKHRSRAIGGPAVFFTVKSPAGDGDLDQDYNKAEGAEEAEKRFEEAKRKTF